MLNHKQITDPIVNQVQHRIVFTGGPLAGKSTIMSYLEGVYGDKSRFMTEVASMLLTNGYPKPGNDVMFSEEWLNYINETIIPTQVAMENGHLHAAAESKKRAVFFDRGLLDPSAYLPEGHLTMVNRYGMDIEAVMSRYSMVIHLQSLACHSTEEYDRLCSTNPARYDTAEMAIERDIALVEAWKGHPNWVFIPAGQSLDAKLQTILSLLHPILDVEIERKFKLNSVPESVLQSAVSKEINQHYIMKDERFVIRTRSYDRSVFELCIKGSGALKRMEWETKIPMELFNTMGSSWPTVSKTRYYIPYGGHTLELDIYHSPSLNGLITLECEFESEEAANKFQLPEWASDAIDVTEDPNYTNAAMACITEGG